MSLGAPGLKRSILVLMIGLGIGLGLISCGGSSKKPTTSGLTNRVLASQGVSAASAGLVFINGLNDTLPQIAPLSAGGSPGLMAISPSRNVVAAFDSASNTVFADDTNKETAIGTGVRISGPTSSMVIPTSSPIGYAAVPGATVTGFSFTGAVQEMNFSGSGLVTTIAVPSAQTVIANSAGTQLLVFSNDSNSVTVLSPSIAAPPVDTSCLPSGNPPNSVCSIIPGFDRPVYGVITGTTAYILNCGPQCGGTQASVMVFDLSSLTITQTIPVDAATWALLNGTTLYVAGTSPTNNACTGQTTAATTCGRLDVVDLTSGTVTYSAVITDGYHDRMDLSGNGQVFIGSRNCTNIGNVNNPSGEVRGCLSIFRTDNSVLIPPDNGDVNGLQGFSTRGVEYVAEGGSLRVYDTTRDVLLVNDFLPQGNINIVGYVGDVKAIDFF